VINAIDYGGGPLPEVPLIQGQLIDVGIDAQIKAQARPPFYDDNYKGTTNGPIMFLRSGDWDGLYALFHSSNIGGNFNWSRVNDPSVDQALVQGRAESDPAKRKQLYIDLCKKLLNDMAVAVPLFDQLSVWVVSAKFPGLLFNGYTYPIITEMATG
jgi:peptide/nickel transport system substrate-binding protein